MSRDYTYTTVTVDATLTGNHNYRVKILLSLFGALGDGALVHYVEQESLVPGVAIEDGDYVMRYTFENKDFTVNRRVTDGGRFLRHV